MKIVVVGCGIAGSLVTAMAREREHEVIAVSDGNTPDSLAATAVLRRAYHAAKPAELEAWKYAVAYYRERGVELREGALAGSYRRPGAIPRPDGDWLLMDPAAVLVQPDVKVKVLTAGRNSAWTGSSESDAVRGDVIIIAAGAGKQFLPEKGTVTHGVTWTHHASALAHPDKTMVYQYAPYRTLMAGVTGVHARVGSSSAKTPEKALEQARYMLKQAWELGWLTTPVGWARVAGARLKNDRLWWQDELGAWRIGGFHRTGYALAPAAARDLLDEIEKSG